MKRPSFQFYPADWRKDASLQSCSIAARGAWIECMCIGHECEPYGELRLNGAPMTAAQIARLIGVTPKECAMMLAELERSGVAGRRDDGAYYSKRMVRDEHIRNVRAAGGHAGAEHGHKGAEHGAKGGRPKEDKGGYLPPLEPAPSSSSSSSSPSSPAEQKEAPLAPIVPARPATPAKPKFVIPPWVPAAEWADFVDMRQKCRKPMTEKAIELKVALLARLKTLGHDPAAVLSQSTGNSWTDLYPIKTEGNRRDGFTDNSFAATATRVVDGRAGQGPAFEGSEGDSLFADRPGPAIAGREGARLRLAHQP